MKDIATAPQVIKDVLVPETLLGYTPDPLTYYNGCLRGDALVLNGRVAALRPPTTSAAPRLLLPTLVEAHCHLDKCHTIDRMHGIGGDLAAAIAAQAQDKANWTEQDLRARSTQGLSELRAAGCRLVRSHIDWSDTIEAPLAWNVFKELAQDTRHDIDLDRAALINASLLAEPGAANALATNIHRDCGTLGVFVLDQPDRAAGIRAPFQAADQFGLALDFHVDEGLAEGLDGLEIIADIALETRFQGPVLCGHACSLMNMHGDRLARLLDKLAASCVSICALPTTNLYLQGRSIGTPDRRGLTRLRELHAAGVPIVVGSDNVADAYCPVGLHDPMAALHMAVMAAQLDPPFSIWLDLITTNAARALGRQPMQVIGANIADLRVSQARSVAELISGRCPAMTPPETHLEALAR